MVAVFTQLLASHPPTGLNTFRLSSKSIAAPFDWRTGPGPKCPNHRPGRAFNGGSPKYSNYDQSPGQLLYRPCQVKPPFPRGSLSVLIIVARATRGNRHEGMAHREYV